MEEVLKNPSELASVRIQAFRSMVNIRAPVEALIRVAGSIPYETEKQAGSHCLPSLCLELLFRINEFFLL